uniref:Uncharacterized protein n=1 Tax=Solanum lycopersicum TaxID=4081 RepID=A0A3Q7GIJ8_SOLLC
MCNKYCVSLFSVLCHLSSPFNFPFTPLLSLHLQTFLLSLTLPENPSSSLLILHFPLFPFFLSHFSPSS